MNANNQVSTAGFTFDGAGNETHDATFAYVWNAESEIKTGGGVNYTYDGDGDRVEKSNGKIYWYGAGSEILDESGGSGNFTDEYVYFGGKRIAMRNVSTGVIYYYAEDLLGSSRALATSTGTLCYDADFFPFGGEHDYTSSCAPNYKFEGKERDAETDNDDFDARYYSSTYGRFLSADWSAVPAPVPYANLTNPQTLNLYAMVSDNPESFADLDGHFRLLPPSEGGGCFTPEAPACYGDDSMDSSEPQAQAQQNAQGQTAQQQNANQSQSNQTQTQAAATTNVAHPNFSGIHLLKLTSDFSAGAGDVLSLGTTYLARKYIFHSDSVVDKGSGAYITGAVTGAVIGAALGKEIAERPNNTQIRVALHEAHHTFGDLGKLAHIQVNVWKAGVSGSGWALRIPLPW